MHKDDQEATCTHPLAHVSEPPARPRAASPADGVLILYLCEDMRVARREVVPILKDAGYAVQVARAHPCKSLDLLSQLCQLVLFDITQPDDAGYQVCNQVRSVSRLPIMLILRREAARADVLRAFEAGADAYVLAPVNPREFLVRLQALLRRRPVRPQLV
jgi:two-component system, OmpR family, response regulator